MILAMMLVVAAQLCPHPNLPPAHELDDVKEVVARRAHDLYPEMDPSWTETALYDPARLTVRFAVWDSGPIGTSSWTAGRFPITVTVYTSAALGKVHSWESALIHELIHYLLAARYYEGLYPAHNGRWTPMTDAWIQSVKDELRARECP